LAQACGNRAESISIVEKRVQEFSRCNGFNAVGIQTAESL
jgi:hypothetical protein